MIQTTRHERRRMIALFLIVGLFLAGCNDNQRTVIYPPNDTITSSDVEEDSLINPEDLFLSDTQYQLIVLSLPSKSYEYSYFEDQTFHDSLKSFLSQDQTFIIRSTLSTDTSRTSEESNASEDTKFGEEIIGLLNQDIQGSKKSNHNETIRETSTDGVTPKVLSQADYIILNQVNDFLITEKVVDIQISGERIHQLSATLSVTCKVVEVMTKHTHWFTRRTFHAQESNYTLDQLRYMLIEQAAEHISIDIKAIINPPRIIQVRQDHVLINPRQNMVQLGDRFYVFVVGDTSERSQPQESHGPRGQLVATVQISHITPQYSQGEIVAGSIPRDESEMLLYRVPTSTEPETLPPRFEDSDGDGLPDYLNRTL